MACFFFSETRRGRDRYSAYASGTHRTSSASTTPPRCAQEICSNWSESRPRFRAEKSARRGGRPPPRPATSDLAGAPYLDEDYLVLSTIHSAKGQEWDAVFLLNVADGNFPSEFSTGRPDLVEEERRLLYVAMTRAKTDLHLMAPLKYYVTQQSRMGDRHVYGAKSRFLTQAVMERFDHLSYGESDLSEALARGKGEIDVAARLRGMW